MLEQYRAAAFVVHWRSRLDDCWHKEASTEQCVEHHHDGRDEKRGESEQTEYCCDKNAPDSERKTHEGHATRTILENRCHVVKTTHSERNDENCQRDEHQYDTHVVTRRTSHRGLRWVECPASTGRTATDEETRQKN